MPYFIIKTGYGRNESVKIDSIADLEKAQYAFLMDAKAIFSNGEACRGKDIISIKEDWHREMGWNPTHEIGDLDWAEMKDKGVTTKYVGLIGYAKENVKTLMDARRTDLIGKPGAIEERLKLIN